MYHHNVTAVFIVAEVGTVDQLALKIPLFHAS